MANPFLNGSKLEDIETAIIYDRATVINIGNAVAYTNERKEIFINTDDNLFKILPNYTDDMLKWLLWHEQTHINLSHANRFFKYLKELDADKTLEEFKVTKEEVNIIMDILVHDWMADKFPDLVDIAKENLAQFRNRNSLGYTFTTFTLEEMLDEYKAYKRGEDEDTEGEGESEGEETEDGEGTSEGVGDEKSEDKTEKKKDTPSKSSGTEKGHASGGRGSEDKKPEDHEKEDDHTSPAPPEDEHDKTDWSKLDKIDTKEFIDEKETDRIHEGVAKLKRKQLKLAKLTETLNGLASTKRQRSYKMPSTIQTSSKIILKGRTPGFAKLYLIFDASGSMSYELETFKKIISETIPQAMDCPCEWFSGYAPEEGKQDELNKKCKYDKKYQDGCTYRNYYKGKFKDIMPVRASGGYNDDGDRVIELCLLAEQKGYTPIGITDGGGCLDYPETLKKLTRTILIGDSERWLEKVKKLNPNIQVQDI